MTGVVSRPARAVALSVVRIVGIALLLAAAAPSARAGAPAGRIVSLNPSLTAIVVALGAADRLVGVDDFSARQQPAVAELPTVGGLYDPSLEAVVALEPDLVVLVPSAQQRDFARRLVALGVAVESFENTRFDQVLENVTRLGALTGREAAARERVTAIRDARASAARACAGGPRPTVVLVLQREPLYVVGRGSFLDELLASVCTENLGARFDEPWPRVGLEWLLAAAPELILDASAGGEPPERYWARWPSLPAVASGRIASVDRAVVTLPGPHLDRAVRVLARAVRPASGGGPERDRASEASAPGADPAADRAAAAAGADGG